jgi:hypothetical protein
MLARVSNKWREESPDRAEVSAGRKQSMLAKTRRDHEWKALRNDEDRPEMRSSAELGVASAGAGVQELASDD